MIWWIILIDKYLHYIIREAYFKHKLSQCELIDGILPEFIVPTKYLQT